MSSSPVAIAIDFETANHDDFSACAIGLARIVNHKVEDEYYTLIRPPSSYVIYSRYHGLTWNDLKDAPDFPSVWPSITAFIKDADYFVAHNAHFDRRVLAGCCARFGLPLPLLPFLDTLRGSRRAYRLPSHKLNIVCEHLGIPLDHHNAASDALGCAGIFINLVKNMHMNLNLLQI